MGLLGAVTSTSGYVAPAEECPDAIELDGITVAHRCVFTNGAGDPCGEEVADFISVDVEEATDGSTIAVTTTIGAWGPEDFEACTAGTSDGTSEPCSLDIGTEMVVCVLLAVCGEINKVQCNDQCDDVPCEPLDLSEAGIECLDYRCYIPCTSPSCIWLPCGNTSCDVTSPSFELDLMPQTEVVAEAVTMLPNETETKVPVASDSADERCPPIGDNDRIATGSQTICTVDLKKTHKVKTAWLFYGGPKSTYSTYGSNHNFLSNNGNNNAIFWWKDYKNGKAFASDQCEEKDKKWWGWKADKMEGGLGADLRYDYNYKICDTGSPRGYWGAGVTYK